MSWVCLRCQKKIYKSANRFRYFIEYRYVRARGELYVEMRRLDEVSEDAVIAHHHCDSKEVDGLEDRMRKALKIPRNADHPLLGY